MLPRRRIALGAAIALLAAGACWFVLAPSLKRPVAPPPVADADVDIYPSGMRARRDAEIALATMPDDPWSFAEALAASAPDKAAERAKEDCGQGDEPQFARTDSTDEDPSMTRAATPRYLAAQARIDAALRASADPLDRAVADFVNAGDMRTEAGSDAAVVAQAAASTDPRVIALGHAICARSSPVPAGCDALTAERWAQVDAGNGMPWIELLAQAQSRGDAAGVDDALARLAASARFDMRFFAVPGAVARQLPTDSHDLAAANGLVTRAIGRAAALPFPPFKALLDTCRDGAGDEQRAGQCKAISDTMYAHSDTLISFAMSGPLLLRTTGDASRRELIKTEREVIAAHWSPATGLSQCGVARDLVHKMRRNAEVGEVEAMREDARKFVTP